MSRERAEKYFEDDRGADDNRKISFIFEAKEPNDTVISIEAFKEMVDFEKRLFYVHHEAVIA